MSDEDEAKLVADFEAQMEKDGWDEAARAVARRYPPWRCYRSMENPHYHYAIASYDHDQETGGITLLLVHGSDSTLPGVKTFGQAWSQLLPCNCGKWEMPTPEQIQETHEYLRRTFAERRKQH